MIPMNITWRRIPQMLRRYEARGYKYIETPWAVSLQAAVSTFPNPVMLTNGTVPVGSAEQGFVQLMLDGTLERDTKYISASPCFRPADADLPDHSPWFFKIELIHVAAEGQTDLQEAAEKCRDTAFAILNQEALLHQITLGMKETPIQIETTPEGWDLTLNDVEIGSYGVRSHQGWDWAYGTGLAEPRFSLALNRGS